jgi:Zn-dependent oligopeptidase
MPDGRNKLVAIFIHDNYARLHKSSWAWMSEYCLQTKKLARNDDAIESSDQYNTHYFLEILLNQNTNKEYF